LDHLKDFLEEEHNNPNLAGLWGQKTTSSHLPQTH
jgi:hypothetical protein